MVLNDEKKNSYLRRHETLSICKTEKRQHLTISFIKQDQELFNHQVIQHEVTDKKLFLVFIEGSWDQESDLSEESYLWFFYLAPGGKLLEVAHHKCLKSDKIFSVLSQLSV